jgi:serine/threonine protein kinase
MKPVKTSIDDIFVSCLRKRTQIKCSSLPHTYTDQTRTSNFSHFHLFEHHALGEISLLGAFSPKMSTRTLDCGIVIGARIGNGLQGKVYLAQNTENECRPIVLKVMERSAVLWDARVRRRFVKESEAYDLLAGHPNIIQPRALCCDVRWPAKSDPNTKKDKIVLVLDVAPGGDLLSYLLCGQLPEPAVRWYARQLLEALAHAHAQGVAHRDIKPGEWPTAANRRSAGHESLGGRPSGLAVQRQASPSAWPTAPSCRGFCAPRSISRSFRLSFALPVAENLLLGPEYQLVLADWGLCARGDVHHKKSASIVGTTYYRAPEVTTACAAQPYSAAAADMWSVGVVLFIALTGRPPLATSTPGAGDFRLDFIQSRDAAALWATDVDLAAMPSSGAVELVSRLLAFEPSERPSAQECLLHPWIAEPPEPGVAAAVFDEMFARRRYIQSGAVADASVLPVGDHLFERPAAAAVAAAPAPAADAEPSGGVAAAGALESAAYGMAAASVMDTDHSAASPSVECALAADGTDPGADRHRHRTESFEGSPEHAAAPERAHVHGVEASTPAAASPSSPMQIEASPAALGADAENVEPAGTGAGAAAPLARTAAAAAVASCGAPQAAAPAVRGAPGSALRPRRLASAFAAGERLAAVAESRGACKREL